MTHWFRRTQPDALAGAADLHLREHHPARNGARGGQRAVASSAAGGRNYAAGRNDALGGRGTSAADGANQRDTRRAADDADFVRPVAVADAKRRDSAGSGAADLPR